MPRESPWLQASGGYCNRAKLAYNSVAGWLEGNGQMPKGIGAVSALDENLRLRVQLVRTDVEHGYIDFKKVV